MRQPFGWKLVFFTVALCILLPAGVTLLWSVTGRWPWPSLLPKTYTLRTLRELFFGSASLLRLLVSSILLASAVAVLGTAIGVLTARALEFYAFPAKWLVHFGSVLPLLIPGTVFSMGVQITLIRLGLSDTVAGVILIHLVLACPYCTMILNDVTHTVGNRLEQQATVLGAGPVRAFFDVTLPQLRAGILSSMSMAFIISYSQYFSTLIVGGGQVKTIALLLVPYIQSGDRALSAAYAAVFVLSALLVFFIFEKLIRAAEKEGSR